MSLSRRLLVVVGILTLLGVSVQAAQPPRARLAPAEGGTPDANRLQPARLAVENTTDHAVEHVALRWDRGGPTFVFPLAIAPGQSARREVLLPASAGEQTWDVHLRGQADSTVATTAARIRWPIDRVDPAALVSPGVYRRFQADLPRWDPRIRMNLIGLATVTTLAMAALAWMHRSTGQLIGLAGVIVAATAVAGWVIADEPIVLERTLPVTLSAGDPNQPDGRALVLTTRRTTSYSRHEGRYIPLYRSPEHMLADETTLRISGGFTTTLSPDRPTVLLIAPAR
ncbi:MAG: hypothetical protein ACOCZU_07890 [Planctomycetota bacterium]